jgi:signal transduction histidine kinase
VTVKLVAVSRSSSGPGSGPDERSLVERSVHDLLNPISAVLGLGETMRARGSDLGDETIRAFGESIVRQAVRLENAVRDLARASRLLRGEPEMAAQDIAAREVLLPFASDRVTVDVPAGLHFRADPVALSDAVARLVTNGLDFSTGPVVVSAGNDETVWIEVADGGIGFDEDALERAFEPLAPGTNARNQRGPGLGVGLYIARRLVEAHGGRLSARSIAGEGSVFRIDLPAT